MKLNNKIKSSILGSLFILIVLFVIPSSFSNASSSLSSYYWNLEEVGIPTAWQYSNGSSEIVVAIIDSGIDFSHPDLVNNSWKNEEEIPNNGRDDDNNGYIDDIVGWDFRDGDNNPNPPSSSAIASKHGTFIAGLIAADHDGDLFTGIAPNVRIMAIRFLNSELKFFASDWPKLVEALEYAIDNGAHIINLSLQALGIPPEEVYDAIKQAYAENISVVGVTGNNIDYVSFPGNYSEVIAVSATTSSDDLADFSGYGSQNELCAPGEDVYSIAGYQSTIVTGSGTSFAAPLVTGAIALMLSLNSSLTVTEIRDILHTSCKDLGESGKDPYFGYGMLDIPAALVNISSSVSTGNTSSTTNAGTSIEGEIVFLGSFSLSVLLIIAVVLYRGKNSDLY